MNTGDTETIKTGEKTLNGYIASPASVSGLLGQIMTVTDVDVRQQAALLLKKKINKHFKAFDKGTQENIKATLIQLITAEPERRVRSGIAGVIACLSKIALKYGAGAWMEIFSLLTTLSQHIDSSYRSLCFVLLTELAESVAGVLKPHTSTIAHFIISGCQDSEPLVARYFR